MLVNVTAIGVIGPMSLTYSVSYLSQLSFDDVSHGSNLDSVDLPFVEIFSGGCFDLACRLGHRSMFIQVSSVVH